MSIKKCSNAVSCHPERSNSSRVITSQNISNRSTPRVGVVRPRIVHQSESRSKASSVAVRISGRRSEHSSLLRQRRDSEQSDDSVVRADEEVRAYMFNTRHKVEITELVRLRYCTCGDGKYYYLTMPSDNQIFRTLVKYLYWLMPFVNMLIHKTTYIR